MQTNVSVSMSVSPVRVNHGTRQATALSWNVTAPCKLKGEVWLCKKDSAGGGCEEVTGSRQSLYNHTGDGWRATANGHWVILLFWSNLNNSQSFGQRSICNYS